MNRFPHDSHSPTRLPSSPVENRRGAPHFRHGRPRGGPESSERGARSRKRSGRPAARWGTKIVVVSQSAQTTSRDPPEPSRKASGAPHVSHSGPPAVRSNAAELSSEGSAVSDPDGARRETVLPSTNANSLAQDGQVPVRRWTSRSSNSIELPHSGQELDIAARGWNAPSPHYVRLPRETGRKPIRRPNSNIQKPHRRKSSARAEGSDPRKDASPAFSRPGFPWVLEDGRKVVEKHFALMAVADTATDLPGLSEIPGSCRAFSRQRRRTGEGLVGVRDVEGT